jgi:hypothetical protein
MHTISKKPGYLLITLEGEATYQALKDAIEEEMARDDYPIMNDIWQFDNCILAVGHDQFEDIVNGLLQRYPQQASRTKTALVASSGLTRAIAQFWIEHTKILPYETQTFMRLDEAEAWIT